MDRAWIELDKEALKHNVESYAKHLPEGCKVMGVVKANAYGHGAVPVALCLQEMGVDHFATAALSEAVEIRKAGITQDILVLGYTNPSRFNVLAEYDITQTITCPEYGSLIKTYCDENSKSIKAHIAVDSGMHRIGFLPEQIDEIKALYAAENLNVTGIFSHLCVGDSDAEESVEFSKKQARVFDEVVKALRESGIQLGTVHLQSSYPAINYPEQNYDYARLGVLMFGTLSSDADYLKDDLGLKPVMSIKAHITSVRWIEPGETVSYGRIFTAEKPTKVASVALGYADGIPRALSGGKLRGILKGQYVYNIGRICMDQLMYDVTDIEDVKIGDTVILVGSENGLTIRAEELADKTSTITNEFISRLGSRLEGRDFI